MSSAFETYFFPQGSRRQKSGSFWWRASQTQMGRLEQLLEKIPPFTLLPLDQEASKTCRNTEKN